MSKKLTIPHVKIVHSRGNQYLYFNTGRKSKGGKPIRVRLPDVSSEHFWSTYASLKAGRTKRENADNALTITKLVDMYQRGDHFKGKAPNTQRAYNYAFDKIVKYLGSAPVEEVKRQDIAYAISEKITGVGARNSFLSTIGALYKWAREAGHTDNDPTKDIHKSKTGEHEPWPESLLEAALICDNDRVRLAVNLLYYTGQRISDVCKIKWTDIKGDFIYVKQQKTGKELDIPMHENLKAELARTKRIGLNVVTKLNGNPIGEQPVRIAIKEFTGNRFVPHGLSKNSCNALVEAGCSEREIAGINGKSPQMIRHYSKKASQKRLGSAAILKWEKKG